MPAGVAQENDLVMLVSRDHKRFFIRLQTGHQLHTHRGIIEHDALLGQPLGRQVASHLGHHFLVLEPSIHDVVKHLRRTTQIVYPKEIGYILIRMNIGPGTRIIEAGTGSGGLTVALARYVQPDGRVYSYEIRPDVLNLAHRNLESLGLLPWVELKHRDIAAGFDETEVDALFLDVRQPWEYLAQAWTALKGGGFFGAILPTANQVIELIGALPQHGFADISVEELLLRPYKPVPGRLRPADRMVAHTGYLIFARKLAQPLATSFASLDNLAEEICFEDVCDA